MPTVLMRTLRPLSRNGTHLPVGGRSYHFAPNADGEYVAEVLDVDVPHILSISAGYEVYDGRPPAPGHEVVLPPENRRANRRAQPAPPRNPAAEAAAFGRRKHEEATE